MKYFSREIVNRGRQSEVDCLKAFTIFIMLIVHAYESCAESLDNAIYVAFHFMEMMTGAAAFMLCMGLGMRYSHSQSPRDYLRRGFELLTVGQLLNIVRDSLPTLIAYWLTGDPVFIANVLVVQTDILTFAGFAFIIMALLLWLRLSPRIILGIGICMNVLALALRGIFHTTGNYAVDQLLGFFVVTDAEAFFPLCCYFVFVAFGYVLGGVYQHIRDKDGLSTRVLQICFPIAVIYYALRLTMPIPLLPAFMSTEQYILNPLTDAAANCVMALCWLALFHKLLRRNGGRVPALAMHLSRHINSYYCVSFVLYTPMETLMYAVWDTFLPGAVLPALYGLLVFVICYFIIEWNKKNLGFTIANLRGRRRTVVYGMIWLATIAICLYAYPRIETFATVWNDYLGL